MRKLILILWLAVTPAWAAPPRTLTANIPITGINRLAVTTTAGAVHITASPDNAIHVQVTLHQTEHRLLWFFHWMRAGTAGDMEAAVLDREKQGGTLVLSLEYPAGDVRSDVHQQWLVQVPAQLALAADMDTGQLAIDGIAGGVEARLGMGDLEINSPRGVLSAKVNMGRLHVVSSTPQPGNIKLTSIFGLAVMDRNGKRLGPPQAHDLWSSVHILGNSVKQRGTGADSMDLKVNFGEVDLHIEPARGGK